MADPEKLAPDDHVALMNAAQAAEIAALRRDLVVERMSRRYGLTDGDAIDIQTGRITRGAGAGDPAG